MLPTARLYHWFSYFYGLREGRSLKPHHVRDGAAFPEMCVPLQRRGLEYGRLVPNGPPTPDEFNERLAELEAAAGGGRHNIEDVVTYSEFDDSFLKPGDTLVVPTRPPMNDLDHYDKVRSQPGFTTLEQKIFRILRPYLDVCSRSHVRLVDVIAEQLPAAYANRADVTFRQVLAPWYKELAHLGGGKKSVRREARTTSAYVFYLAELPTLHGADLLVAFGMGGTQTLILCNRLRNDLAWVLDKPGFTMFEMTARDDEAAYGGLEFADLWSFDVVLQTECLPAPSSSRAKLVGRPELSKSVRPAPRDAAAGGYASPRSAR